MVRKAASDIIVSSVPGSLTACGKVRLLAGAEGASSGTAGTSSGGGAEGSLSTGGTTGTVLLAAVLTTGAEDEEG